MAHPNSNARPTTRIRPLGLAVAVIAVAVLAAVLLLNRSNQPVEENQQRRADVTQAPAEEKPGVASPASMWEALVQASPYQNVRPGVKYVDDASCAECHSDISESYAKHPMGRSLSPTSQADRIERFTAAARNPLKIDNFIYQARQEGDRQFHQETRLSPAGAEALVTEFEAVYAVGSGRTGRSYLIERDAHLFLSPLTWYAEGGWDLSPGYEKNNSHFNRPAAPECLFCHANRTHHVEGTLNEYESPIFAGHAIGCQRCHGPGEVHVAAQQGAEPQQGEKLQQTASTSLVSSAPADLAAAADHDTTIVNPARLTPELRESVCQQCHLGGLVRVEARGRRREDFRPGLPWHAVAVVFLAARDSSSTTDEHGDRFVGHVERMHQSVCFAESGGKLGCISCHDPHSLPVETAKVDFYRQRCLECHGEQDCEVPVAERKQRQPDDSCYACHMPQAPTQIRHAAATDHRIPRSPDRIRRRAPPASEPAWSPLVAFHKLSDSARPHADFDDQRNLGVALVMGMDQRAEVVSKELLPQALTLLERAVAGDPADVPARQAYAITLARSDRLPAALGQMEEVLRREPRRESALNTAASLAMAAGQWPAAASLLERAREVNPWIVRYWADLGMSQARQGRWDAAAVTCEDGLKRFPDSFGCRQLLIQSHLLAGRRAQAEREYERMIELNPPNVEAVRRWWESQSEPRPRGNRPGDSIDCGAGVSPAPAAEIPAHRDTTKPARS